MMDETWATDWVCTRTFYVVNHRPFHPTSKLFKAKVMWRVGTGGDPFKFGEIASKVVDWNPKHSDVMENILTDDNRLRCDDTQSYPGSKQKSRVFMESMIKICTSKGVLCSI
ncbi:hypothetical protein M758_UG046600 [Ceratodon purpureus]|nr:hypothetical protein M758_UG046600 [Ceratodon purpureus]